MTAASTRTPAAAAGDPAPADTPLQAELRPLLLALETRRTQALVARDLAVAGPLHAPDYQLITPAGKVFDRERYLQAVATGDLGYSAWEMGPVALLCSATLALLRYPAVLRFDSGREVSLWHTDAYALRDGQWLAVWSQATARPAG